MSRSLIFPRDSSRARGADFQVAGGGGGGGGGGGRRGLMRTRKREQTREVRGHAHPGKFHI